MKIKTNNLFKIIIGLLCAILLYIYNDYNPIFNTEINESNEYNHKYNRDDYNSSATCFYDPIRDKKVGIKNYALYLETNTDITSDDFSYLCPYSNQIIDNYQDIDWDHIIPLHYVHEQIGYSWTAEQKQQYALDLDVGVCVNYHDNRVKSDSGPSEWLPEYNQKWYCQKWLDISEKYNIPLRQEDIDTINLILNE